MTVIFYFTHNILIKNLFLKNIYNFQCTNEARMHSRSCKPQVQYARPAPFRHSGLSGEYPPHLNRGIGPKRIRQSHNIWLWMPEDPEGGYKLHIMNLHGQLLAKIGLRPGHSQKFCNATHGPVKAGSSTMLVSLEAQYSQAWSSSVRWIRFSCSMGYSGSICQSLPSRSG